MAKPSRIRSHAEHVPEPFDKLAVEQSGGIGERHPAVGGIATELQEEIVRSLKDVQTPSGCPHQVGHARRQYMGKADAPPIAVQSERQKAGEISQGLGMAQ